MKLCIDCKYFKQNTNDWTNEKYQIKHAICTRTSVVSADIGKECWIERQDPSFLGYCGKKAKHFEAK